VNGRVDSENFALAPRDGKEGISPGFGIERHDATRQGIGGTIQEEGRHGDRIQCLFADKAVFAQHKRKAVAYESLHLFRKVFGEEQNLHGSACLKVRILRALRKGADRQAETFLLRPECGESFFRLPDGGQKGQKKQNEKKKENSTLTLQLRRI